MMSKKKDRKNRLQGSAESAYPIGYLKAAACSSKKGWEMK